MHAETSRFSISFHSPEMSCTVTHISLPETPAEIIHFRSSLLLPQMNHISYNFGCPRNYCFQTAWNPSARPGPIRFGKPGNNSIGNTRNCGGYYCFQDTINCSWNPSFQLLYQWGGYGPRNGNFRVLGCRSRNDPFMLAFQLDQKHRFQVHFQVYLFCCWYEPFPKRFWPHWNLTFSRVSRLCNSIIDLHCLG